MSAAIAEIYAIYSPSNVLTSTITVLVGFIIYKISFIVLFHIDNKRNTPIDLPAGLILIV